jgi:hypothetical protein
VGNYENIVARHKRKKEHWKKEETPVDTSCEERQKQG